MELTLKEATELAKVTPRTIWVWCKEERFKFRHEINGRLKIEKDSFLVFLDNKVKERNKK